MKESMKEEKKELKMKKAPYMKKEMAEYNMKKVIKKGVKKK